MNQKTLIALGAFAVIGVAAFLTLKAPDKGQRIGPPPRPVAAFKAADVKALDLASNGGKDKVSLVNEGGSWKITQPGQWKADQQLVKTATDQLEKLGFGDLVTEQPAKFADLEVSDDKGAHVVAKDGAGKVLLDGWFGKSASGFTMFRPTGKQEVWQTTGAFKYTFARDAKTLRDHTILEVAKDDVTRLTVEASGQKLVLEKPAAPPKDPKNPTPPPSSDAWKVVESTVKVDPLDENMATQLVQTLGGLRAQAFADDVQPKDAGLAPPKVKLTVVAKGQPQTLLVGATKGDETWLQLEGKPQIYVVQKYTSEKLDVDPANFRDKTIAKVKEADLVSVEIQTGGETLTLTHDGNTWKNAKAGGPELDPAKVKGLVSAFESLQGERFANGLDAKTTGLDKPVGTATLKLQGGKQEVVKVGAVKDGTDQYVQRAGSSDVVLVKKYAADRFLKKASDLVKPAAPPRGPGGPHGMPGMPGMPPM